MIARHLCAAYSRLSLRLRLRGHSARLSLETWLRAHAGQQLSLRFLQCSAADGLIVAIDDLPGCERRAVAALVRRLDLDPHVRSVRWERVLS